MKSTFNRFPFFHLKRLQAFIKFESASGILLFIATLLALIMCNSSWQHGYHYFFYEYRLFNQPIIFWINEGLMTFFFLLVGLEIKREWLVGELDTYQKRLMPGIAAIGGMIVPAAIYILFNWKNPHTIVGWAIPSATDIAFALGVLLLLGSRIPIGIKIFLMALAIIDDLGAVVIISLFYTSHFSKTFFLSVILIVFLFIILNRRNKINLSYYFILGLLLWGALLKTGIHPTIAGVIMAFFIPLQGKKYSPLRTLEHYLHPWVAFGNIPVFAIANAGLNITGLNIHDLMNPLPLGIIFGLFFGKPIGVLMSVYLAIKLNWGELPEGITFKNFFGVAILCGIGFTMSLFIGNLAFEHLSLQYTEHLRLGVLTGSFLSGILGYSLLRIQFKK